METMMITFVNVLKCVSGMRAGLAVKRIAHFNLNAGFCSRRLLKFRDSRLRGNEKAFRYVSHAKYLRPSLVKSFHFLTLCLIIQKGSVLWVSNEFLFLHEQPCCRAD